MKTLIALAALLVPALSQAAPHEKSTITTTCSDSYQMKTLYTKVVNGELKELLITIDTGDNVLRFTEAKLELNNKKILDSNGGYTHYGVLVTANPYILENEPMICAQEKIIQK